MYLKVFTAFISFPFFLSCLILFTGCSPKLLKQPEENRDFVEVAERQAQDINDNDSLENYKFKNLSIEQMLTLAESFCKEKKFGRADTVLKKVIAIIDNQSENGDNEWFPFEEYLNKVIKIYSELMPSEFPIPDDIAVLVFQKQMFKSMDSVKLPPQDSAIMVKMLCKKDVAYDVPITWNDRVLKALYYYVHSQKETVDRWFIRSSYYLPFIKKLFADSSLPQDLAYLPLIESGFSPNAYSRSRASGIWQFISSTGQIYGLRHTYWVDERKDPIKSTTAAICYLKKLYNEFGNWHLALAAYNCGEGGVERAISKSTVNDYWQLSLPSETMNYVPLYIAALTIAKNPDCFGFSYENAQTFELDTVFINDCIDLKDIARSIGIEADTLRKLNPHILHWCTPPDVSNVMLYLPHGTAPFFKEYYSQLPDNKKVKWYRYRVKRGDNIGSIASQFRLPVEAIKTVNKLKGNHLVAGCYLLIPIPVSGSKMNVQQDLNYQTDDTDGSIDPSIKTVETKKADTQKAVAPRTEKKKSKYSKYRVQPGDTPYSISRKFNMSIEELVNANNLDSSNPVVYSGDNILVKATGDESQVEKTAGSSRGNRNFIKYVVSPGENLFRISKNFSIPLETLLEINNLTPGSTIHAGDTLLIPKTSFKVNNTESHIVYYKVKQGDNLWTIASSFGVNVKSLFQINNLKPDSVLMPGDMIKIMIAGNI